jgi:DNA methyltransferase 1-associated protein 1
MKQGEIDETYPFAKFNKKIEVISYTEDEYKKYLALNIEDPRKVKWSKPDTDLLFQLCDQFQLRFINVTDRFNFQKYLEFQKKEERNEEKFGK